MKEERKNERGRKNTNKIKRNKQTKKGMCVDIYIRVTGNEI